MISGNCNRSPQYNAMGPPGGAQRYNPQAYIQQQQQHPHLLFMAGGSVKTFPQMSRGFSMMHNRGGVGTHPPVVQCSMQHGFGNSFGYHASPGPMFHQHHHLYQQPQVIHHQQQQQQQPHHPQPQYVPQQLIAPPPAANHNEPTSGFINGIKNMVKGIINPLNCDFYSDHHKYYNPKYRNNYLFDIKADTMSYKPAHQSQPECHVKMAMNGLETKKPTTKIEEKKPTQSQESTKNTPEVVAIFSSEDFPELPAPRRSRSATPAKTEITPPKPCEVVKEKDAPARNHPPPKGTFFEIMCTTTPCGKRPTFGGRLKVVPPPFSLNQSIRSCLNRQNSTTSTNNNNDCDIEEDSFVIFSNNDKPGDCVFTSFRPPRQRQLSECSDDSFVVFFTEDAELQIVNDDDDDDDDDEDDDDDSIDSDEETSSEEEEDSSDDDDEEDDGIDVVDSSVLSRIDKTDRNKCDHETTTALLCSQHNPCDGVVPREHKQFDSGFDEKKVTFDPHPVVHVMHAWNYAYRAARKGHWEDFARDRTRFQKRIERTSVYLNPVLTPEHREKIYRSRFCDDAATNQQEQLQQQQCTNPKLDIGSLHRASASRNDDSQKLPKLTKLPDCASF